MNLDPAPDHVVIGFYADSALPPFVLSCLSMCLQLLEVKHFDFELKTAVLARGLLVPAEVRRLLNTGQALVLAAKKPGAADADEDIEDEEEDEADEADLGLRPAEGETTIDETEADEKRLLWRLTLPEVLTIATAADFAASSYLTPFGEEARAVQLSQGMPAEEYDARILETLGYFGRFQQEWNEIFADYPAYQQHRETLAALRVEFLG